MWLSTRATLINFVFTSKTSLNPLLLVLQSPLEDAIERILMLRFAMLKLFAVSWRSAMRWVTPLPSLASEISFLLAVFSLSFLGVLNEFACAYGLNVDFH